MSFHGPILFFFRVVYVKRVHGLKNSQCILGKTAQNGFQSRSMKTTQVGCFQLAYNTSFHLITIYVNILYLFNFLFSPTVFKTSQVKMGIMNMSISLRFRSFLLRCNMIRHCCEFARVLEYLSKDTDLTETNQHLFPDR